MEALKKKRWAGRLTLLAAILCFGAVVVALIAALGSARGAWHFRLGFKLLEYALYAGAAGILVALIAAYFARRVKPRLVMVNLIAILVAGAFVGFLGNQVRIARTCLASTTSPPSRDIRVSPDHGSRRQSRGVPDMGRRELAALTPRERWKAGTASLATRPIRVPWTVGKHYAGARLAEERGGDRHLRPAERISRRSAPGSSAVARAISW